MCWLHTAGIDQEPNNKQIQVTATTPKAKREITKCIFIHSLVLSFEEYLCVCVRRMLNDCVGGAGGLVLFIACLAFAFN